MSLCKLTLLIILCNELTRTKWKVEGDDEARQTYKTKEAPRDLQETSHVMHLQTKVNMAYKKMNITFFLSTLKCWLLWGLMRKQDTKQSIMSSTSAFWLPVPLQKGLAGLNSRAWWNTVTWCHSQAHFYKDKLHHNVLIDKYNKGTSYSSYKYCYIQNV